MKGRWFGSLAGVEELVADVGRSVVSCFCFFFFLPIQAKVSDSSDLPPCVVLWMYAAAPPHLTRPDPAPSPLLRLHLQSLPLSPALERTPTRLLPRLGGLIPALPSPFFSSPASCTYYLFVCVRERAKLPGLPRGSSASLLNWMLAMFFFFPPTTI